MLFRSKWRKADEQNWELLRQIGDQNGDLELSVSEVRQFSCHDFQWIEQIWSSNSAGKFGYHAQIKLIRDNGDTPEKVRDDVTAYRRFALNVGWKKGGLDSGDDYVWYDDLDFTASASPGELPALGTRLPDTYDIPDRYALLTLFSRAAACNL